jgi:hypothetical protein
MRVTMTTTETVFAEGDEVAAILKATLDQPYCVTQGMVRFSVPPPVILPHRDALLTRLRAFFALENHTL